MDLDHLAREAATAVGSFLQALAPAAFGAAVAQAWKTGLSWSQRLMQWGIGICVSHYVTAALAALFRFDPFVIQAVGFVLGMIAFEATPKFIQGASGVVGNLPADLRDRWFRRKGDPE